MSNRRAKTSQLSLSQSLFRRKSSKLNIASNNSTSDTSERTDSETKNDSSHSQPISPEFDDSFDLFLPKKLNIKHHSSQSSFFEVKKSKTSRYFDKNGQLLLPEKIEDDDLDLALAVSLQESKGTAVIVEPVKSSSVVCSFPKGKYKKAGCQSLLMRRSADDRERIITEKVAIVLMNSNKISPSTAETQSREPCLLYSAFLNERNNTLKTLWNLSQADLPKVKLNKFITDTILSYMTSSFLEGTKSQSETSDLDKNGVEESGSLRLALSEEDIFQTSGEESGGKGPSPKRLRTEEPDLPVQDVDSSVVSCRNDGDNLKSPGDIIPANEVYQPISSPASISCDQVEKVLYEIDEEQRVSPIVEAEHAERETCVSVAPCAAETSSASENRPEIRQNKITDFVDDVKVAGFSKHRCKLSADLSSLPTSGVSWVKEIRKGAESIYAHGCILNARCPPLSYALESNSACLDEFPMSVCKALLRYIYTGDVEESLKLSLEEKSQLIECCLRFGLEMLEEELFFQNEDGSKRNRSSLNASSSVAEGRAASPTIQMEESLGKVTEECEDVIVLDSDCCSGEEKAHVGFTTDEEFDSYLNNGFGLSNKNSSTPSSNISQAKEELTTEDPPDTVNIKEPKRSIEKYFQDSFPSLDGLRMTPPPPSEQPKAATPSSRGVNNCVTPGGQLVVSELATPLPDYESMVTPELKDALQKYGIKRGIGRRKAVTLLRYIYDQIHPPSDHPAVTRAIGNIKSTSQLNLPTSESDIDVYSLSSDSSGDAEMFEDLGDVLHSQLQTEPRDTSSKPSLLEEVGKFIKSNSLLYAAILKYEPIWLNKFHQTLKDTGIKCNKKELMEVLDELGITFRTEQTEKQLQRRRKKKPQRRKK